MEALQEILYTRSDQYCRFWRRHWGDMQCWKRNFLLMKPQWLASATMLVVFFASIHRSLQVNFMLCCATLNLVVGIRIHTKDSSNMDCTSEEFDWEQVTKTDESTSEMCSILYGSGWIWTIITCPWLHQLSWRIMECTAEVLSRQIVSFFRKVYSSRQ